MNIAISIRNDIGLDVLLGGNGIMQNAKFLYDLFALMGHQPYFLYFGDPMTAPLRIRGVDYKVVRFEDALNGAIQTPVILEVGVTLTPELRSQARSICNSKIVVVRLGNTYMLDLEDILFNEDRDNTIYYAGADWVWISPHFELTHEYHAVINQAPVSVCPFLWEADFINEGFADGLIENRALDIYVMEPNMNAVKNALIPLCIISETFKHCPDSFGKATILNALKFNQKKFFLNNIIRNLPGLSNQHDKVFFTGRYSLDEVFKQPDVLLSFQRDNALNYLSNEALYKGIPFVHNSEMMQDVGYYYPDYRIQSGVEALRQALSAGYSESITHENRRFLQRYSIHNRVVQQQYHDLLKEVLA